MGKSWQAIPRKIEKKKLKYLKVASEEDLQAREKETTLYEAKPLADFKKAIQEGKADEFKLVEKVEKDEEMEWR